MENSISSYNELLDLYFDDNDYNGYYYNQTKDSEFGKKGSQWKMHLFLNQNANEFPDFKSSSIKKISKFLIEKDVEHKFANGNDGYKTLCIYTGDIEDTLDLAKELKEKFDLSKFGKLSDNVKDNDEFSELFVDDRIGMRFSSDENKNKRAIPYFTRYGYKGIPIIFPTVFFKSLDGIDKRDRLKFKSLLCHVKLAEMYGENYVGKNYKNVKWDVGIFSPLAKKYGMEKTKEIVSSMKKEEVLRLISKRIMGNQNLISDGVEVDIDSILSDNNSNLLDRYKKTSNIDNISKKWDNNPSQKSSVKSIVDRF